MTIKKDTFYLDMKMSLVSHLCHLIMILSNHNEIQRLL